jgi:hypothetical protein
MIEEYISLIVISTLMLTSAIFNLYFFSRHKKLIGVIAQLIVDKEVISNKMDEINAMSSKEFGDGFIKFLSESRDAAFDYIETVQGSIKNYLEALEGENEDAAIAARLELFSHLPDPRASE